MKNRETVPAFNLDRRRHALSRLSMDDIVRTPKSTFFSLTNRIGGVAAIDRVTCFSRAGAPALAQALSQSGSGR